MQHWKKEHLRRRCHPYKEHLPELPIVMRESNSFQPQSSQSNTWPNIIYFPQQWSDPIELESETNSQPQSLESMSSIEATIIDSLETPQPPYHNQSWLTLACKLRQQNQELIKTVVHLEQALEESQHQLHNQKLRARNTETFLTQQTQELSKTKGQVTQLTLELEQVQQFTKNKQLTLNNFAQQLEDTQQQAAQLERECAFLKEDNTEKTQKLIYFEQQIDELRSRLHRQQRYTLQYKAALDRCLELPLSQILDSSTSYIAPQVTSIQPWSSNWQPFSSSSLPELRLETSAYEEEIKVECSPAITINLEEENISPTTDITLFNLNDENEIDTFLQEFLASFESDESILNQEIEPPDYASQKLSSKIVELPNFI